MRRPQRSLVGLANEKVPITLACRLVGLDIDDIAYGRSIKMLCPFGSIYHIDGGHEPAFRVYPESNSAYCFAGCGYFTPVWLCAYAWDRDTASVASDLLERVGIKRESLTEAFASASRHVIHPDTGMLAEALKMFCQRISSDWEDTQFEPGIAATLTRCLALLDRVSDDIEADQWLRGCKRVMLTALKKRDVDSCRTFDIS